jgi:hypothetical protein
VSERRAWLCIFIFVPISGARTSVPLREPPGESQRRDPPRRNYLGLLFFAAICLGLAACRSGRIYVNTEEDLRRAVLIRDATIVLPSHPIALAREIVVRRSGASEIEGTEASVLKPASPFQGLAVVHLVEPHSVALRGFSVWGGRNDQTDQTNPIGLPPSEVPFIQFYKRNGIVVEGGESVLMEGLHIRSISDFGVLASGTHRLKIENVSVENSGSLDSRHRNNTSGGILLEEGVLDFEVSNCSLRNVRGNGIWTHSRSKSPRNSRGRILSNYIERTARDAIQIGHATDILVENNRGKDVGFPPNEVDIENLAVPVALDTSGNVDFSRYIGNRFEDIDGTCINLDGFHDGVVRSNLCQSLRSVDYYPYQNFGIVLDNSNPDMQSRNIEISKNTIVGIAYGGLFLLGSGHRIIGNIFRDVNRAHCTGSGTSARCTYGLENPGLLRSGVFLARAGSRIDPAENNVLEDNEISGFGMDQWCIQAAKGVDESRDHLIRNRCFTGGK